jgi:hypothetical protein
MMSRSAIGLLTLSLLAILAITVWLLRQGADSPPPSVGAVSAGGAKAMLEVGVTASSSSRAIREEVDGFPDGRIWIRVNRGEAAPSELSLVWATGRERCVRQPAKVAADDDGWWKVSPSSVASEVGAFAGDASGDSLSLAVGAEGFAPSWLVQPQVDVQYQVELVRLTQSLRVLDIETGELVSGALVRLSRLQMEGEAWAPNSLPGASSERAIFHSQEQPSGGYMINGEVRSAEYLYEVDHPQYVISKAASSRLLLGGGLVEIAVQMPVVASVRFVGDELLDGQIRYAASKPRGRHTYAKLRKMHADLSEKHSDALTVLFLNDVRADGSGRDRKAKVTARLLHGERRSDLVPVVRLADFEQPTDIYISSVGPEIPLQKVTVTGPPKFGGVAPSFRAWVVGEKGSTPKVVQIGGDLQLPPGNYRVVGGGDFIWGALKRSVFQVTPGEPVEFRLEWKKGLYMYKIQAQVPEGTSKIQLLAGDKPKQFAVDAPIDESGLAVLWIKTLVKSGRVYTKGCEPVDVVFHATRDPAILVAECKLVRKDGL